MPIFHILRVDTRVNLPIVCRDSLHALCAFRSYCFDKAGSGHYGD